MRGENRDVLISRFQINYSEIPVRFTLVQDIEKVCKVRISSEAFFYKLLEAHGGPSNISDHQESGQIGVGGVGHYSRIASFAILLVVLCNSAKQKLREL